MSGITEVIIPMPMNETDAIDEHDERRHEVRVGERQVEEERDHDEQQHRSDEAVDDREDTLARPGASTAIAVP